MNTTFSDSFRKAREAALNKGEATAYNNFDRLYRAALVAEAAEARGEYNLFDNTKF